MSAAQQRAKAQLLEQRPDPEEQRYVVVAASQRGSTLIGGEVLPDPGSIWDDKAGAWVTVSALDPVPYHLTYAGRAKLSRRFSNGDTSWRWEPHYTARNASSAALKAPTGVWVSIVTIAAWRTRELERAVDHAAKALGHAS